MGKLREICYRYSCGEEIVDSEQIILTCIKNILDNLDTFYLRQIMIEFIKYFSINKPTSLTRKTTIEIILSMKMFGSTGTPGLIDFISYLIDSEMIEMEECIA